MASAMGGGAAGAPGAASGDKAADLGEIGVESGPTAHVRAAVVGQRVHVAAAGLVLGPPDALDDDDAGPRVLGEVRGEPALAPRGAPHPRVTLADAASARVGGVEEDGGRGRAAARPRRRPEILCQVEAL